MTRARRTLSLCLLAAATLAVATPAGAEDYRVGDIRIDRPWARATPGQVRIGAAYFTLEDVGGAPDRLLRVESPVAAKGEIHTHMAEGSVMQMRPVGALEIRPGAPTVLQPGGLHVMLIDLKQPLKAGDRFALTLEFEHAGRIEIMVPVERIGARGPGETEAPMPGMRHGS
jgi:copper(I)-binding protein